MPRAIIAAVLGWFCPAAVSACTVCESEAGQQVRAGIFGDTFWPTLLAVLSPFPVLLVTIVALRWLLSRHISYRTHERDDLHV